MVCDISPSGADRAAVREACALAGRRGHVALVCVVAGDGRPGPHSAARGAAALAQAMKQARAEGVPASAYLLRAGRPR